MAGWMEAVSFARRAAEHRRPLGAVVLVGLLGILAYLFVFRASEVAPHLTVALPVAAIGEGDTAVAVSGDGVVLDGLPAPKEGTLPRLPLSEPPKSGRLAGPMLQQARVLGAAPAALRPCIAGSYYGETGVDVELRSGIELRFGDASRVEEKWRSAIAVLADPSITSLDYVDLHSPRRPAIGGSGHALPTVEEATGGNCGV